MSLLSRYIKEKEYDVRMIQRGLSKGLVLQDDVEKNQKRISDDTDNADWTNVEELVAATMNEKV